MLCPWTGDHFGQLIFRAQRRHGHPFHDGSTFRTGTLFPQGAVNPLVSSNRATTICSAIWPTPPAECWSISTPPGRRMPCGCSPARFFPCSRARSSPVPSPASHRPGACPWSAIFPCAGHWPPTGLCSSSPSGHGDASTIPHVVQERKQSEPQARPPQPAQKRIADLMPQ